MQKKEMIMLVIALALLFVGVFDHSLWTPDEPRVADISRTMAITGDYLIPHLAKEPFLEQPPLYYAVTGFFWKVLGASNEGFGRLSSTMFALGSLLVVFFGIRRLYEDKTAILSTLMLATTVGFFNISHRIIVDNSLAFFITAALFSFLLAYQGLFKKGYLSFWICISGAFLTKGVIGLAIPGFAVALFVLWQKDFAIIKRAWVIRGILIVAGVIAAWGVALYLRGGTDFLYTFFMYNNLGRFANVGIYDGGHVKPFYHYLPVLFSDGMPWSLLLLPALFFLKKPDARLKFFYCWFFGGLILLTMASTKRNLYFLPMYPALVTMAAVWMTKTIDDPSNISERRWLGLVAGIIGIVGIIVPVVYVIRLYGPWPSAACVFILTMAILWALFRYLPFSLPERIVTSWAVLLIAWSALIFPQLDTLKTYKPFFEEAGKKVGKDSVIGYNLTETALAFSSFYGGFYAEDIHDRNKFIDMVSNAKAQYVLLLPRKNDMELTKLLEQNGQMLLKIEVEEKKPTELWRLSKMSPEKKVN